jgi:hypothetical protein
MTLKSAAIMALAGPTRKARLEQGPTGFVGLNLDEASKLKRSVGQQSTLAQLSIWWLLCWLGRKITGMKRKYHD